MNKQNAKADTYCLEVSNFGPIVEANVEMRPLTVFVGPSNTGKSYLAILLYALHLALRGPRTRFRGMPFEIDTLIDPPPKRRRLNKADSRAAKKWAKASADEYRILPIPYALMHHVRNGLDESVSALKQRVLSELNRCFSVDDPQDLVRKPSKSTSRIILRAPTEIDTKGVKIDIHVSRSEMEMFGEFPNMEVMAQNAHIGKSRDQMLLFELGLGDRASSLIHWVTRQIFHTALKPITSGAIYYLPADRTGVMHAHQALVSALIQSSAGAGIRHSEAVPMLSGVLADFLSQIVNIGQGRSSVKRPRSRIQSTILAEKLEKDILAGEVQLNKSESGYPLFDYQPEGWKNNIPLMRSSSMVSELAPVVLYLRHLVLPGDILIIEEPESHLHPEMQTVFARQIALLVQAGIRVIVTTHSEWLLDQVANLVRISEVTQRKRKELVGGAEALHPDQFGAWLFKKRNRPKGSIVEEIRVSAEAGGLVTDFTDTADQLYNTWAEAGNLIRENRANSK